MKKSLAIGAATITVAAGLALPIASAAPAEANNRVCKSVTVPPAWPWYKCINLLPGSRTPAQCHSTSKIVCS